MSTTHRQAEAEGFTCENCGRKTLFPAYCAACGTAYPERRGLNLFDRISVPRTFFLDPALLDRREVELSRDLHPDRFTGRGAAQAELAISLQAALNEALRVLRDPFARAEYLLSLSPDGEALKDSKDLPPGFLAEQLELREELDQGVSEERAQEIKKWARRRLKEIESEVAERFRRLEAGEGDAPRLRAEIRRLLNQVRYIQNVQRVVRGGTAPVAAP